MSEFPSVYSTPENKTGSKSLLSEKLVGCWAHHSKQQNPEWLTHPQGTPCPALTLQLQPGDFLRWELQDLQRETWRPAGACWTPSRYSSGSLSLASGLLLSAESKGNSQMGLTTVFQEAARELGASPQVEAETVSGQSVCRRVTSVHSSSNRCSEMHEAEKEVHVQEGQPGVLLSCSTGALQGWEENN
jgi:hypothetical protein